MNPLHSNKVTTLFGGAMYTLLVGCAAIVMIAAIAPVA